MFKCQIDCPYHFYKERSTEVMYAIVLDYFFLIHHNKLDLWKQIFTISL